ncbi:nucleoside monophosphate kinase [Candidatus Daviesbacteria bacterium]|nr:nucleoside monophosphate kinase [Candidatus Daviesbacteria bacterium]
MKILIVGLPGSGKTTQIDKIAQEYGLIPVRMGNILRDLASKGGKMGERVKSIMASGELVDDETVAELIKVEAAKIGDNFIMEGYPRTMEQVKLFDPGFDKVFYLGVPIEVVKDRMKGRGRSDDSGAAIEKRVQVQMEDMEDILSFYKNVLVKIDGTGTIEEVFKSIEDNLQ